jgi:hypothetical protein
MDMKQLSDMHPLYSRLTGQVIWLLFEENDARQEDIDAFMDLVLQRKERELDTMRALLENPALYLRVELQDVPCLSGNIQSRDELSGDMLPPGSPCGIQTALPPACSCCAALHGHVLPASHPQLLRYMPPYGLGCRCTPRAITAQEATGAPLLTAKPLPPQKLHCDSGWLFHMCWAQHTARTGSGMP